MKKQFKWATRRVRAIFQAASFSLTARVGLRGPSRSCQIPGLAGVLSDCLGNVRDGQFVEVGAYDGEKFSNTSWLADNGWRGLYVEPSKEFSRLCKLRHCLNKVQVANCAAGAVSGEATLMQMGSLSTMNAETFAAYQDIPWAKQQMDSKLEHHTTPVRTLDSLLDSHSVSPGFDVLVVDVEGFEESVFRGFDVKRWKPRLMIVELCDDHIDLKSHTEVMNSASWVRSHILSCNYVEVYRDSINTIFARPDCAGTLAGAGPKKRAA